MDPGRAAAVMMVVVQMVAAAVMMVVVQMVAAAEIECNLP
jgi:hypothetical protein